MNCSSAKIGRENTPRYLPASSLSSSIPMMFRGYSSCLLCPHVLNLLSQLGSFMSLQRPEYKLSLFGGGNMNKLEAFY